MLARIQPFVTKKFILPLWALVTGSSYLNYYRTFRNDQWRSLEEIRSDQFKRLKKILIHSYETTEYYQKLFDQVGFSPYSFQSFGELTRLPYLTKNDVRNAAEALISRSYPKSGLIKNATGGSTGTPVAFYVTKERELAHAATMTLNYQWAGLDLGDRLAMIWGSPFDKTKYQSLKGNVTNILLGRLFLPGFVLSDDIFKKYLRQLKKFRPKTLLGYTSILTAFANYLEKEREQIPSLQSVISGAETLYPHQREYLEKVFRCQVFNRYGGRDSGAVAAECPKYRRMHINTNVVYVEQSPDHHIIITDLWNKGMPFIRYDTEDIGEISNDPCPCGRSSPYFKKIEGRVHDLLITPDGKRVPGEFFPHLFKDVLGVKQFQVIQVKADELLIRVVMAGNSLKPEELHYLQSHIKDYFGQIKINFTKVDAIPKLASGKFRFTISNISSQ